MLLKKIKKNIVILFLGPLAQLVEHFPFKEGVIGSNPIRLTKSYINHLINTNEILGSMILTMNNIVFYQQLMEKIREAIKTNTFDDFYKKYINVI